MRKTLLAGGLACLCALTALAPALAQQSMTVHRNGFSVPLPDLVTSSDHFLDMGNTNNVPVGSENKYMHVDNGDALDEIQAGPNLEQNW